MSEDQNEDCQGAIYWRGYIIEQNRETGHFEIFWRPLGKANLQALPGDYATKEQACVVAQVHDQISANRLRWLFMIEMYMYSASFQEINQA